MKLEALIKETFFLKDDFPLTDSKGPGTIPGWDSVGNMRLIMEIESAFSINFSDDEMISIESVGDIKRILTQKNVSWD